MTSQYLPQVGDVVDYKGNHMVIIKSHSYSFIGDYYAYLVNKEFLENSVSLDMDLENLDFKCSNDSNYVKVSFSTMAPYYIPFKKIDVLPIEVQEVSCIKVQLKE